MKGLTRWLFWPCLAWGLLLIWMAPRPMLVDLPQHAAQISLLNDLLAGHSRWAQEVEIRWATPYLAAYVFLFMFSQFTGIVTACKLTLSVGYLATVGLARLLRQRWQAPAALDSLLLIGFFNFNYDLGFITLMMAAPFAMLWLYLADMQRAAPGWRITVLTGLIALVTLMAHPVMWLFAAASTSLALLMEWRRWQRSGGSVVLRLLLPALVSASCTGLAVAHVQTAGAPSDLTLAWAHGHYDWTRLSGLLFLQVGAIPTLMATFSIAGLLIATLLISGRGPALRSVQAAPFWVVMIWYLFGPSLFSTAAALHVRMLVLFFPAWVWSFGRRSLIDDLDQKPRLNIPESPTSRFYSGQLLAIGMVLITLATRTAHTLPLMSESTSFEPIIARMEPGKRVLYLPVPYTPYGPSLASPAMRHFGLWYQAEKHGLVDMNFGWGNQMIVRFRPTSTPHVMNDVNRDVGTFDWNTSNAGRYDYFLVHLGSPIDLNWLFRTAPCPPQVLASNLRWVLLSPANCSVDTTVAAKTSNQK